MKNWWRKHINLEEVEVMTKYEIIATVVSIIAVSLSILIPLTQWAWKKWAMTSKVKFYPTGQAMLYFNQSGSYIRINGVLESERKATTIKKLRLILTRKRDDRKLNLVWAYLISPVNQGMIGGYGSYIQTLEAAHPLRVEADSIACAFVEYSDPSDASGIKIRKICSDLMPIIQQIVPGRTYEEALSIFTKSPDYIDAKNNLLNDFVWDVGKYTADIIVEYGKHKEKMYSYELSVSEQNSIDLRNNIDEALIVNLKSAYQVPLAFKSPMVEIQERQK